MPLKARSVTKSNRSPSNNGSPGSPADTPIQFVKGVGPRLGAVFQSRGISTVKELLTFFPRAYEDRTRLLRVADLVEGVNATVAVRVQSMRKIPARGRTILEVRTGDESGTLALKWFHAPRGMEARFKPGTPIVVTGAVKIFMGRPEIIHPEISWNVGNPAAGDAQDTGNPTTPDIGRVVPIYTEIEGVSSRVLRKVLWEALQKYSFALTEDLPETLRAKHHLPELAKAVRFIHFPEQENETPPQVNDLVEFNTPAHARLIYEEFFKFEYLILRQRLRMEKQLAIAFGANGGRKGALDLAKLLPFELTAGQKKAVEEILNDLSQPHPMNRLIQGDVGSGKTAVAFISASCVLAEGYQAALMAPTEILAEQHYKTTQKLLNGRLNAALLTGKTPAAERATLLARLASGEPLLLIGTHALIEEPVVFKNLAYILIDEQHRFGVEQRRALRMKGRSTDKETGRAILPHSLVLTATPIPRTLALTAYGDLAVTSIRELPPGRQPIQTQVVRDHASTQRAFETIRGELRAGRQAYFIYPLVNESEAEGFTRLKSAVNEAERLQNEVFPEFKVGLLHGQQKPDEKAKIMAGFEKGEIQILVSTTVVEVGVDVPNATVMAIQHAERFGLSQLHQLRGRVGRGMHSSFCFLFSHPRTGETTTQRLEVLEQTQDGFKIAEADLDIRGPGEFLGIRQSGGLPFRMAHLVRDQEWLIKARDDATALLREDPDLLHNENSTLRRFFERDGHVQFERLKTS
ncbi:MAG: ATP-dependent DNA helicase RecG [Oligoflexia bacterium]|nr:ATP-dependent DNA helicase RecG [Oligoflexia bacterium]